MFSILSSDVSCIDSINVTENIEGGQSKEVALFIESLGHAALVFVNKQLVGIETILLVTNFVHNNV